jgi:hypothetical protein
MPASRFTAQGLATFGKWLYTVRNTPSLWPDALRTDYPKVEMISQRDLVSWFLTQYETLGDYQFFLNVLKQTEHWRQIETVEGIRTASLRFQLALMLARTKFLIINGTRIDCSYIWVYHDVMNGDLDPLSEETIIE